MTFKRIAGAAAVAGALGAAALGLGAGSAQADPIWVPDIPGIPWGPGHWIDELVPDVGDFVPGPELAPGQLKKLCPWNSPPGHWMGGPHGVPCSDVVGIG